MKTLAIARNTFREAVRDKVFGLVGAFGLLLVISSVVLSPLTVGAQNKIVADVGLASITLFALLIILFVGSGMVHKEIDRRTIMTLLSKPVTRVDYIVGKYLGMLATLGAIMGSMSVLFLLVIWITPASLDPAYFKALLLAGCEMVVVTALAVLFSSFTTPVLTSLFTLAAFLVGHTISDLERFARVMESGGLARSMGALKLILPNLELFNVRNAAVHGLPIEGAHVAWAVIYSLLYAAVCITLAGWIFQRREFK